MKLKYEFGHYTEVRTASTKAVKKVRVFVSTGCQDASISKDYSGLKCIRILSKTKPYEYSLLS